MPWMKSDILEAIAKFPWFSMTAERIQRVFKLICALGYELFDGPIVMAGNRMYRFRPASSIVAACDPAMLAADPCTLRAELVESHCELHRQNEALMALGS